MWRDLVAPASAQRRSTATRAALLFFLMNDLVKLHTYYIFSLSAFKLTFFRGIDNVTEAKEEEEVHEPEPDEEDEEGGDGEEGGEEGEGGGGGPAPGLAGPGRVEDQRAAGGEEQRRPREVHAVLDPLHPNRRQFSVAVPP